MFLGLRLTLSDFCLLQTDLGRKEGLGRREWGVTLATYSLETLVYMCVGRRGLAIIEAKLTVIQVRRVKPRKGKGFNQRNVEADLGLRPGLQTLA